MNPEIADVLGQVVPIEHSDQEQQLGKDVAAHLAERETLHQEAEGEQP